MIPTELDCKQLWDKYQLPEKKRIHVQKVCDVALFLAHKLNEIAKIDSINEQLLCAACLLHDIDKNIPREGSEKHPETGVRILKEERMDEVATLITYHSVQFIGDTVTAPKSWEEKLLFLSDKMVKQEIISVDERFALWLAEEDLPEEQKEMLRTVYPKVKVLEREIFGMIGIEPSQVAKLLESSKLVVTTKEAI